jgi:hypothetical protein
MTPNNLIYHNQYIKKKGKKNDIKNEKLTLLNRIDNEIIYVTPISINIIADIRFDHLIISIVEGIFFVIKIIWKYILSNIVSSLRFSLPHIPCTSISSLS